MRDFKFDVLFGVILSLEAHGMEFENPLGESFDFEILYVGFRHFGAGTPTDDLIVDNF